MNNQFFNKNFFHHLTKNMDKTMSYASLLIPLSVLLVVTTACQPKIEKHITEKQVPVNTAHTHDSTQGTESYGGNITPLVMLNIYDILTFTSEQWEEELKDAPADTNRFKFKGKYPTFKDNMLSLWKGLELYAKGHRIRNVNGKKAASVARAMLAGNEKGDIFDDIQKSKYQVKFEERFEWMNQSRAKDYAYGKCQDYLGNYSAAAAKLEDVGGEICVNVTELARQTSEDKKNKLWAILSHEHCHHFGFLEQDCVDLQNIIERTGYELVRLGQIFDRFQGEERRIENGMSLSTLYKGLNNILPESKIKFITKITYNPEAANEHFKRYNYGQDTSNFDGINEFYLGNLERETDRVIHSVFYSNSGRARCTNHHDNEKFVAEYRCEVSMTEFENPFLPLYKAKSSFRYGNQEPFLADKIEIFAEINGEPILDSKIEMTVEEAKQKGVDSLAAIFVFDYFGEIEGDNK